MSNPPPPQPAPAPQPGPGPESHFLDVNGARLHHLDWGNPEAPPLVLVHGIRLHAHVWGDFCRRNRKAYHLLALDQRGHGDSGWAEGGRYSLHGYCEDLAAVMDARGLEKFTLIGHSLGARVSLLYTHLHPGRVARLVLVDMGAGLPPATGKKDFSRITETPPPRDFASREEATDYLSAILRIAPRELVAESVEHGMRKLDNGRFTWKYDPALGGAPKHHPGTKEWDLWEAARGIGCPTLLLHGEHSQVVTSEILERMEKEMPDLRTQRIDNAGHSLFTDQPEAFAGAVGRFLDETAP